MALHLYPVTIRSVSPPIQCLLSRPTPEFRPAATILYFHGLNGTRNQIFQDRYLEFAEAVKALGCNLLSLELRAHGERRDKKETPAMENLIRIMNQKDENPFDGAVLDIKRTIEFIIEKQIAVPGGIGVCGLSWGALHAMYAMKLEYRVKCGVALLPVGRISRLVEFRRLKNHALVQKYEPMQYLEKIAPKPLLMITADQDTRVDARDAGDLYEKLYPEYLEADAVDHLTYRMLLGATHAYDSRMTKLSMDWFRTHMLVEQEGPTLD